MLRETATSSVSGVVEEISSPTTGCRIERAKDSNRSGSRDGSPPLVPERVTSQRSRSTGTIVAVRPGTGSPGSDWTLTMGKSPLPAGAR